jgi:hypothetical protein
MIGAFALALGAVAALVLAPSKVEAITGVHFFGNAQGTVEVCVMCHVPHRAPKSPLLWNHVLSANNYSWSDWTQTTGGRDYPGGRQNNLRDTLTGSQLCLDCHTK